MFRAAFIALALAAAPAFAQDAPMRDSAILTVTPDRILAETRAGRAISQRYETATRALVAENRQIEGALEAEERELTARRAVAPPEEFARLSADFDKRVDGIRTTQDTKSRDLTRRRDTERQALLQAAVPILAEMMQEAGAVAILDRGSVFLSFDLIDVTDRAIALIDEKLEEGEDLAPAEPEAGP